MYCCPEECPGFIPQPHHLPGYAGHIPSFRHRNGATFGRLSRNALEDPCVAQAPIPVLAPQYTPTSARNPCCRNPLGCDDIGCCDPVYCPPPPIARKKQKPKCEEMTCDPCKLMKCFPGMQEACVRPFQPRPAPLCVQAAAPASCGGGSSFGGGSSGGCGSPCGPPDPPCPPRKNKADPCMKTKYFPCGPSPPPCCDPCGDCDPRAHHLNRGPYACPCKPESDNMVYRCCESMSSSYAGHIPGFDFHSTGRTTGKATWGTKQYMNKCLYFNTFRKP